MDFTEKYTNALNGNTAIMMLTAPIGKMKGVDDYINGRYFADEMYYHNQMGRSICVYVNSPGGKIFDGMNIIQAMLDTEADSHIVGMAASMAGIIAAHGKKRTMNDCAIAMIHPPGGAEDVLLELCRGMLKRNLMGRSKIGEKKIDALLAADAPDSWFDSSQMLEMGLVDTVVNTGNKGVAVGADIKKIMSGGLNFTETFQLCANITNTLAPTVKKPKKMEQAALAALLGLPTNATEAEITAKINENKADAAAKQQLADLTAKVTNLEKEKADGEAAKKTAEDAVKAERTARATDLVSNAVTAGKIKESVKAKYIEMATANYDLVKETLDGIIIPAAHASAHNFVDATGKEATAAMTYEDMAKNHPLKLQEMAEKEPAKFEALVAAHNKKK